MLITNMNYILLALLIVCSIVSNSSQSTDVIFRECEDRLKNIDTIERAQTFIKQLQKYHENEHETTNKTLVSTIKPCVEQYDSIIDLKKVLPDDNTDLCHPNHVSNVLQYHYTHIHSPHLVPFMTLKPKPMIRHFFRRYMLHISLVCRRNLVSNLKEAMNMPDIEKDDFLQVLPWRQHEPPTERSTDAVMANESESILYQISQTKEMDAAKSDVLEVVDSIDDIDHLAYILPIGWERNSIEPNQVSMSQEELLVFEETSSLLLRDGKVVQIIDTCDKLAKFYEGSILSIVRMSNAGYNWPSKQIDRESELTKEDLRLKSDWLAVSMACFTLRVIRHNSIDGQQTRIEYHSFGSNRIGKNEILGISPQYIKKNSLSKGAHLRRVLLRNISKMGVAFLQKLIKKVGLKTAKATKMQQVLHFFQKSSGDRPSMMDSGDWAFLKLIGAIVAIILISGLLIAVVVICFKYGIFCGCHHHHLLG